MIVARKNNNGAVIAEFALAIPIFLMLVIGLIEVSRALYIQNTMSIAAQRVANLISVNTKRTSSYNLSGFGAYTSQVRFPGSVVSSDQFSFDVTNAAGASTVAGGLADGATSTKVVVMVVFPPPGDPSLKIPIADPGNLVGIPVFGPDGLQLNASATCFIERSRRPTLN